MAENTTPVNTPQEDIALAQWYELPNGPDLDTQILLDVRNPEEIAMGAFPNAINIPLPQLSSRLNELPRDKEIITACAAGLRGHTAACILLQNGFTKVRNLSGGYRAWSAATKK